MKKKQQLALEEAMVVLVNSTYSDFLKLQTRFRFSWIGSLITLVVAVSIYPTVMDNFTDGTGWHYMASGFLGVMAADITLRGLFASNDLYNFNKINGLYKQAPDLTMAELVQVVDNTLDNAESNFLVPIFLKWAQRL